MVDVYVLMMLLWMISIIILFSLHYATRNKYDIIIPNLNPSTLYNIKIISYNLRGRSEILYYNFTTNNTRTDIDDKGYVNYTFVVYNIY